MHIYIQFQLGKHWRALKSQIHTTRYPKQTEKSDNPTTTSTTIHFLIFVLLFNFTVVSWAPSTKWIFNCYCHFVDIVKSHFFLLLPTPTPFSSAQASALSSFPFQFHENFWPIKNMWSWFFIFVWNMEVQKERLLCGRKTENVEHSQQLKCSSKFGRECSLNVLFIFPHRIVCSLRWSLRARCRQ